MPQSDYVPQNCTWFSCHSVANYTEHSIRLTCHINYLSYRQIHTAAKYYQFSFYPMSIVLWNKLLQDIIQLSDLDSFKQAMAVMSKITCCSFVFILILNISPYSYYLTFSFSNLTYSLNFQIFLYSCIGAPNLGPNNFQIFLYSCIGAPNLGPNNTRTCH